MADALVQSPPKRITRQQIAWGVMLASFAIFCAIAVFAVLGIRYFLFESRIPLQSSLQVARGTATMVASTDLLEQAVRDEQMLPDSAVVTTDTQSQASISFRDLHRGGELIATVILKNGSSLNLTQDSRPRFDWSSDSYWINFEDVYGDFEVFVPQPLARPILITFDTTLGPSVRLSASGRYALAAAGGQVQVTNDDGEALLMASNRRAQPVPVGEIASVPADADQFTLIPTPGDLLGDPTFTTANVLDFNATADQVRPQVWRCINTQNDPNEAIGSFDLATEDGRPALHFFRDGGAESHGETRCVQPLGTGAEGLDISAYSHVSIRATFKIESQSLSTCGVDASECPMMLALDYIPYVPLDPVNPVKTWFHGFYASVDPNRAFPLICASCNEQHEIITPGVWYTYESRYFLESFAEDQRPKSILNVRFYASGHQYDVYVSQVALVVDQDETSGASLSG